MKNWNVGVYLRISVEEIDATESNSIGNQKILVNNYLRQCKDINIFDYYIDDGYSGTSFDRPGFQKMILDIKEGKINAVVVKDLSRFGRNYIEIGNYFDNIFPMYSVRFIAINDTIDSYKDPKSMDSIIVPVKNLINDQYARDISYKVRTTILEKKRDGQFTGATPPYGYLKSPNNKYEFIIDEKTAPVVKKIFDMVINGKSKIQIIDELNNLNILTPSQVKIKNGTCNYSHEGLNNKWNRRKVDYILKNKVYTGVLIQGTRKKISYKNHKYINVKEEDWIICENHHSPIISNDKFNKVQNILHNRDIKVKNDKSYDLLSSYLECVDCKGSFTLLKNKKNEYYYCSTFHRHKLCSSHSINKKKLLDIVKEAINVQISLLIDIKEQIKQLKDEEIANIDYDIRRNKRLEIEANLKKYNNFKNDLYNDLKEKFIDEDMFISLKKDYNKKITKLKNELINLSKMEEKKKELNYDWIDNFANNKSVIELNNIVINEMIDKIYIYSNSTIKIKFKYENEYFRLLDFINDKKCAII